MKLLADEGVAAAIVARLRSDGHDVVYVAELMPGITDEFLSEELQELINAHVRVADQGAERADGQFLMQWNGKVDAHSRLHHNEVTSHLPNRRPAGLLEYSGSRSARYIGEAGHRSHGNDDGSGLLLVS